MKASGNFLTGILSQMWNHINVAVSSTIKNTLEHILKDLPIPLYFIKLYLDNVPITTWIPALRAKSPTKLGYKRRGREVEWELRHHVTGLRELSHQAQVWHSASQLIGQVAHIVESVYCGASRNQRCSVWVNEHSGH